MSEKPDYVRHVVNEDDVTVDWFFGPGRFRDKIVQLVLVIIGWFFAILPIVITVSALTHRHGGGWWHYREGYVMWDVTIDTLGLLAVAFIIGFISLYLVNQRQERRRTHETTYDEERLALRLGLADDLYENKYGPADLRQARREIRIEPYADIETYELRDIYRTYGVD
ncbi:MAG: hypothetical protein J2O46_02800 [Nocardioides sp.]|nr:hypothetical protein [Nocardioides sp.]